MCAWTLELKWIDEKKDPIVIHYHVERSAGRAIWRLISGKRTEKPKEKQQTENK